MNRLDEQYDGILSAAFSERVDEMVLHLSNADRVTPAAKHKLSGILKHYAKMEHPFTACVRDNRKRFGKRAEAVCAVLKDIIWGTTKWRGKHNPAGVGPHPVSGLSEAPVIDEETAVLIDMLSELDLHELLGLVVAEEQS
jgi:hypothetical protein